MNECLVATYPYGPEIRLIQGPLDVSFTTLKGNFQSVGGKDRLARHGYDRTPLEETVAKQVPHLLGSALITQPPYGQRYKMSAQLQLLTNQEAADVLGMIELQSLARPIILYDRRLVTREKSPRTRAKIGIVPDAPITAGIDIYFAQYKIWITEFTEPYRAAPNCNYLSFEAVEFDSPIPPSQDISLPP